MRRLIETVLFTLLQVLACGSALAATSGQLPLDERPVIVAVTMDVMDDYTRFLQGRDPLSITVFSGEYSRRDVVEVVLMQQALRLGGFRNPIIFKHYPTYLRSMSELKDAFIAGIATTVWKADYDSPDLFYTSEPLIPHGEFEAGFYVRSDDEEALSVRSCYQLRQLPFVSNRDWKPDWDALKAIGITDVRNVNQWELIVRLVGSKRARVTLVPFQPTPDMGFETEEVKLVPIPNMKIALSGERVFVVSKYHPLGVQYFRSLARGLDLLRDQGTIRRAYTECGFFNPRTKGWKNISKACAVGN